MVEIWAGLLAMACSVTGMHRDTVVGHPMQGFSLAFSSPLRLLCKSLTWGLAKEMMILFIDLFSVR